MKHKNCHSHEHKAHDEQICSCGCEHGKHKANKSIVIKYVLGAIPIIIGFIGAIPFYIPIIFSVTGYLIFGFEVWKEMISGIKRRHFFTEFTLMCVATLCAFVIGEYADAAAVMYLYSLGEAISDGAYSKSKKNISELLEITPEYVNVFRDGKVCSVPPEQVEKGEFILVRLGERVPIDGRVLSGGGNADTSSVTGEEKPLELYEGIECPSGALLTDGSVVMEVLQKYENSVVARMQKAVEDAKKNKSLAEKKITKFASVFTPISFAVAAFVFIIGWLITGNIYSWLKAGITVLVVSCPCSLVLSVPLTYFAGMGNAARCGIIFKGGEVMDSIRELDAIAFDKTGTLTDSKLRFDGCKIYGNISEADFLKISKAVLTHSPHAAAVSFCDEYNIDADFFASNVENIGGKGIICNINGKKAIFGNRKLMEENDIITEPCNKTCIYGVYNGEILGHLEFSAHIKQNANDTIKQLKRLSVKRILIISGDTENTVKEVASSVGADEYYSACTPDEKLSVFEKIKAEQKGKCAYCGDGLNDSAVISSADVGIAMGACGSALTVDSADVILMDDNIEKIIDAIKISRRTSHIANSNIALSLGIKIGVLIIGVILAMLQTDMPIELAIVADVGAAVLTVLNSLRAAKKEKS